METERDAANFVRVSAGWGYHAHIPNENKNWNIKTSIALLFLLISLRRKTVFDERFFISWFVMVEKGCFIMSDLRLTMGHDCMYSIVVVILVALLALDEWIAHAHRTFTATKNMHIFFSSLCCFMSSLCFFHSGSFFHCKSLKFISDQNKQK